jgi:hypothetical protein
MLNSICWRHARDTVGVPTISACMDRWTPCSSVPDRCELEQRRARAGRPRLARASTGPLHLLLGERCVFVTPPAAIESRVDAY